MSVEHAIVPLDFLQPEERARIAAVDGEPQIVHRLEEIGLRVGTLVEMVRPGRPCILKIHDHRLSLRPETGTSILVEVL